MYYVTGVSRGLGLAIVNELLKRGDRVCGIGRRHNIDHPNFSFIVCDLSDPTLLNQLNIDVPDEPIILINNAGILGKIGRISEQSQWDLSEVLQVNTIAPMKLALKIYDQIQDKNLFSLVNISSGAANRSIPSWAAYCASKAAINRLSESFFIEERERGHKPKVYAISPGVIDTDMQVNIRASSAEDFSEVQNFIDLKSNSKLFSATESAVKILRIIDQPYSEKVIYDVRDI